MGHSFGPIPSIMNQNKVSFQMESKYNDLPEVPRMADHKFSNQNININIDKNTNNLQPKNLRSLTVSSPSNPTITDFRQILQRYQQNKDQDIDYTNYMQRNFNTVPSNKYKRRETYASYLQFQHLPNMDNLENMTETERQKMQNMPPDEQLKYK